MILETIALIVAIIFFLAGLIVSVFGIGGTFLVFAGAALYNLITWSWTVHEWTLGILLFIAVLGEILEWVLSVYGGKKAGMSNWTLVGFILGAIVGLFVGVPILLIGPVVGAFIGAFVGAFLFSFVENKDLSKAFNAGIRAFLTRLGVSIMKIALALIMIVIFFLSVFF